jgi:hypothetical protein
MTQSGIMQAWSLTKIRVHDLFYGCAIPFKDGHTPPADFFLWCGGQGRPTLP